jgi:hydroxymethylbilane synthase
MNRPTLKLGTRRSLLAWSQSDWVAREIERLNPGTRVELVGIDTRGDKIQDVSLRMVAGKEFFVAELDEALRSGAVDLTVHSMKDLSLERPEDFVCAAIPRRENPRDVALFGPEGARRALAGERVRIGTSSPRRLENIPGFLARALPQPCGGVEFAEIRGNVNTRLSRVHEAPGSERYLDGVILAFAGLIRLWANAKAREEMRGLLQGVRWMVLPLRECPAAPAQGALAVECRAKDARVREAIARLHDAETAAHVRDERQLLEDWGGGCHQRFGATSIRNAETGSLLYVRGRKPPEPANAEGEFIDELRWARPERGPAPHPERIFDGSLWRVSRAEVWKLTVDEPPLAGRGVFVSHSRAVPDDWRTSLRDSRVWTSGTSSWLRLAEKGLWVEGCSEGLGYDELAPTLLEGVLQLPALEEWTVLTHQTGVESWSSDRPAGQVIATYTAQAATDAELAPARERLPQATDVYWSSGSQFDELKTFVAPGARHACGPGKTARHLRDRGVDPMVFPSVEEWRKWLKA